MQEDGSVSGASSVVYIDDGSQDATWEIIEKLSAADEMVSGIRLSRNHGHQNALLCGLMTVPGDILISVDADLQDDLLAIPQMVSQFNVGCDIVYGVRRRRTADTPFKRLTAETYYRLMKAMNVNLVFNHADYRLMSRRALVALSEYGEVNLFLRGMVRLLGYKTAIVEYERRERFAGRSKYPFRKMLSFAWEGLTSFSTAPLQFITALGLLVSAFSVSLAIWSFYTTVFTDKALPGWASTVIPIYFLGGVQLLSIGIIGQYIGKIFLETKARPRFQIDTTTKPMLPAIMLKANIDLPTRDAN
ncbi:glycosyltransferase family 2 protein [Nostoc sp. CHAB 5834]|nr:glycosyltransferase family 2 protein [Nostoc sp. CHAB 5834]